MLMRGHRRSTGATAGEQGFTIIELAVGMVLLAVLMAGAVYGVVRMSAGTDELGANQKAQRQAIDALETMRKDVGAAKSPAMFKWNGTRDDLRDVAYHFIDDASSTDARAACGGVTNAAFVDCLRGIVVANPRELWLRTEARASSAGGECVGYSVSGDALRRYVNPNWRDCGPGIKNYASTVETRLVVAPGLASNNANPFRYTMRYNANAGGARAFARFAVANISNCRTFNYPATRTLLGNTAATQRRAAWIVGVEVNLGGVVRDGDAAAATQLRTSVPVTSHIGGEHVYAVGCSY